MREAIGGTMMFWLVLFFMAIFIAFMAAIIQYGKVYRVKNSMINYLEQHEGLASRDAFEQKMVELGYDGDYVFCRTIAPNRGGYYYIKLYATFGVMNMNIYMDIKGETRLIETGVFIKDSDGVFGSLPETDTVQCICRPNVANCSK